MFQTRRKIFARALKGSRVDRRRTRVGLLSYLDDSGESEASTPSTSSESESEEWDSEEEAPVSVVADSKRGGDGSDPEDACATSRSRRKRSSAAVLTDTSSDSDSDVGGRPVRKVLPKKRLNLQSQLSDSEAEAAGKQEKEDGKAAAAAKVKEAAAKRRERQNKLLKLSQKRRSRTSSSSRRKLKDTEDEEEEEKKKDEEDDDDDDDDDDEDEGAPAELVHSSEEDEADSDSMKDFIVEDEEQKGEEEKQEPGEMKSFLSHHLPGFVAESQLTRFQVVIKAFLINVLDPTFLKSLCDGARTKKYAQAMKKSLYHLDQRVILPRLENLKQRSRWSDRYKERVECYPDVRIIMTGGADRTCQACQLHRNTRFRVSLSGQLYDNKTLQQDEFMPDDKQVFLVGSVCASRTEVYHQLKHFKYHLYGRCRLALEEEEEGREEGEAEPVKDTVSRVYDKLKERGWIAQQYEKFQEYLNAADYFQEEKLD